MSEFNTRILVIDDEQIVRDAFTEILSTKDNQADHAMDDAAAALFGDSPSIEHRHENVLDFVIDVAVNGKEGFEKVQQSLATKRPYALIFCDMRMPGWDGLTTVQQIRTIDAKAEIVFVTAYSDHSAEEISNSAGPHVGYHCKPFEADEIRQIATKGVCDYNKFRDLENLISITASLSLHDADLEALLKNVLHQVTQMTDNQSALFVVNQGQPEMLFQVGGQPEYALSFLQDLAQQNSLNKESQTEQYYYLPMSGYGLIMIKTDKKVIDESALYLIRLFVQQAAKAIDNSLLHKELAEKKRLADMGRAASFIVHDLMQPLNIFSGALSMLKSHIDNPDLVKEMLEMMSIGYQDMKDYVTDILEFSNEKKAEKVNTNMKEFGQSILDEYALSHPDSPVKLQFENYDTSEFFIDGKQIRRAVKNIINNGIDVLIDHQISNAQITLRITQDGSTMRIEIADNGPGVPAEIQDTLFTPFVTKGKAKGTGLGLAISQKMTELNGGTLTFTTGPEGTTFVFSFHEQ